MRPLPRQPTGTPTPDGFSLRELRYPADFRQERHHHEETTATLVFEGSLEEVVGARREQARPLSVVFKPAGTEHANRIGPSGAMTLQLSLGAGFLGGPEAAPAESEWGWSHGGVPTRRFLELFAAWRSDAGNPARLEGRILDILAAFDGLTPPVEGGVAPAWLERTVEEIEDTFRAPRRVRDLAADAGIHAVALARAHRRHFGCSISERIRRRRVDTAADLLGRDVSLSEVAFRTGFSDQSHLTRVFKADTGLTPGRYRELRLA